MSLLTVCLFFFYFQMKQINEVIAAECLKETKTIPFNYEVSVIYKKH